MAKLMVNNQQVEQFYNPNTPEHVTAQLVHEQFGESATFEVQLSDTEQVAQNRIASRSNINQKVADSDSLLGTTSDTTHILLNELSGFINKLSQAQSLAEMRASTASLKAAIGGIEQQVTDGTLEFPYQVKGQAPVLDEIYQRATGVSQVLKQA
ncbi:hypothetical protein PSECIP111854_02032 [Pseudoalteromonas sp. CIP111854]|uniref:Uncharacterized protein n=1 Tax=Pseudoalteromonas holothuriae TaxID=2963714 RepID=A0A9W4VQK4_9GAMM|nr:hypothetical protein [Pseudoalteromonas sp. CIP111854]CAH9057605.1 hypothetical protein PSECIP111854_02032 [Pseudoalteromonas sp. CIP111854]